MAVPITEVDYTSATTEAQRKCDETKKKKKKKDNVKISKSLWGSS